MGGIALKRKGTCEFIGAYVPQQLAQMLRLHCLFENDTLSHVIEKLLEDDLVDDDDGENPLHNMADFFAKMALFRTWQQKVAENEGNEGWKTATQIKTQFKMYIEKKAAALKSKGLNDDTISRVVTTLKGEYEKDKKIKRTDKDAHK